MLSEKELATIRQELTRVRSQLERDADFLRPRGKVKAKVSERIDRLEKLEDRLAEEIVATRS